MEAEWNTEVLVIGACGLQISSPADSSRCAIRIFSGGFVFPLFRFAGLLSPLNIFLKLAGMKLDLSVICLILRDAKLL